MTKTDIKKEITLLLNDKKPRDQIEIIKELGYDKQFDSEIIMILNEMVNECDLYFTKNNRYMNFYDSEFSRNLYKGIYQSNKSGFGFVSVDAMESDVYIKGNNKNLAMDGDLVLINITKSEKDDYKSEGEIIKVLKRNPKLLVGTVIFINNQICVKLDETKDQDIILLTGDINQLVEGDKIVVKMLLSDKKNSVSKYIKRIGHINDPDIEIKSILAKNSFNTEFSEGVIEELKQIPNEVLKSQLNNREDLRNQMIFTIDGDDTKDIDDAISIKKLDNGNYELGVHIADISNYVLPNTSLDKEAYERGTSVYLADRVEPMLPHQLSNGICSLNPDVDRLTISCIMEINTKGEQVDFKVFPAVIKSKKQMTYKNVNKYLDENIIESGYENYINDLTLMKELSSIIRKDKINRGFIDFNTDEAQIIVDSNGKCIDVIKRERGTGEKLIEDFMIIANECIATYLYNMDLPSIYRVHGDVKVDRLRVFLNLLGNLGINVKDNLKHVTPKTIQKIIEKFKDREEASVLSTLMLSCMDKAKYQPNNIGHFGIASRCYTHFTAPIRRYPDLIIHRLLHDYFFSEDGITEEKINHYENILTDICYHTSERERASMKCEREVEDMKMAEYMMDHIDEEYDGIVSGVTSFGIFVILKDKLIEGMIKLDNMDDFYIYDPNRECLIGERTHKIYTIGTKIKVKVIGADKETRKIDFEEIKGDNYLYAKKEKVKTKH